MTQCRTQGTARTYRKKAMDLSADRRFWANVRSGGGWLTRAWALGQAMRPVTGRSGELFVVGTSTFDPWHVTAHLEQQCDAGTLAARPTLLRWQPPADGPAHLRHSVRELATAGARPVLVVAPDALAENELEQLADARRRGSTLFSVAAGEDELSPLCHEQVIVDPQAQSVAHLFGGQDFEVATHLLAMGVRTSEPSRRRVSISSR